MYHALRVGLFTLIRGKVNIGVARCLIRRCGGRPRCYWQVLLLIIDGLVHQRWLKLLYNSYVQTSHITDFVFKFPAWFPKSHLYFIYFSYYLSVYSESLTILFQLVNLWQSLIVIDEQQHSDAETRMPSAMGKSRTKSL